MVESIESINNLSNISLEGIYSHFSLAYYKDDKWTIEQFNRFVSVIEALTLNDIEFKTYHICNSPAFQELFFLI